MPNKNIPSIEELFSAGAHFGHVKERSHPKSFDFVHSIHNKVVVIDLQYTKDSLESTLSWLEGEVAANKKILFVGTKRQAAPALTKLCTETGYPYVVSKWLGGTLTNFVTIKKNLVKLAELEKEFEDPSLSKQEKSKLDLNITRMKKLYGGLKELTALPDIVFVIDGSQEVTALKEAKRLGITTSGIIDTTTDPRLVEHPIIANDDSTRSIELILDLVKQVLKGNKEKSKNIETIAPITSTKPKSKNK